MAVAMFARWSQEDFFKYMREHYGLDRLVDYATDPIPETTKVVNPAYRTLDGHVRSKTGVLIRKRTTFGAMNREADIAPKTLEAFERAKAALQEEILAFEEAVEALKGKRNATPKHITLAELPEAERFEHLRTHSKHLIDTIKMVAYRAETAMAQVLPEAMSRHEEARSLLRNIYRTEADLIPDEQAHTLTVVLHHLANRSTDKGVRHLCEELNATETIFPGTTLRLVYELGP